MGIADLFRSELEALAKALAPLIVAELEARGAMISAPAAPPPPSA